MPEKPDRAESDPKARDEVLKRMLKMKPKPHVPAAAKAKAAKARPKKPVSGGGGR